MHIQDFALERWFARWEFSVKHVLGASDVEGLGLEELLSLADAPTRELWSRLTLGYTESLGHPVLRAEIASLYDAVAPDDVLTLVGAEEGIFLVMHALLEAGDHAVVVWPSYQSLHEVARSIGADVTLLPLAPDDWSLDLEHLRRALRPRTRVIVINFPHNPTGAMIAPDALSRLVDIAESHGAILLSDEVYRFLEADGQPRLPAAVDLSTTAMSLGVLSKSFALAGLRIGWIATRNNDLLQRIARLKDYTTICGSAPSEILGIAALRARDRVLARSRQIVSSNSAMLDAFLSRSSDLFRCVPPRGGSTAYPEFLGGDVTAFADALVEREGVLIVPGSRFGDPSNHCRIGLGRRDMPEALKKLEHFARHDWPKGQGSVRH
jgi:aspartate/methionine/tyrosine aminotransferase